MDTEDPRTAHPQPPQPKQQQEPPGTERKLDPPPDHGEKSYKGSGKLQGRAALITGADSGIGRAVAIAFAREGADVLISYLCEDEDARETARWVEQAGRRAVLMPGDVSDPAHCRALVDRAVREFGRLDVLVNNAAHQMTFKSLDEISDEEWDKTFRTNIYSMFYLSKAAVKHMKPGSAIVNTTSINAKIAEPDPAGLCHDEGRDRQFHGRSRAAARQAGHPRQLRRAGADLDAADPVHDGGGVGRELRQEHAAGARRTAGRAGAGLCAAGQRRRQLHDRRAGPGHRRPADAVRAAEHKREYVTRLLPRSAPRNDPYISAHCAQALPLSRPPPHQQQ